ncbi:ROK family protein [Actinokineospora auranticolor]|nr:ROK family protein [Actinokineospora auranticolor]
MSRAAATTRLGLTRTAVGDAAAWLTDAGILRTAASAPVGRGRPSPLLGLADDGPVVAVAHLRPDRVDVAVVGLGVAVAERESCPVDVSSPDETLARVAADVAAAVARSGRWCVGVVVALAGMTRSGVVRNAVHFGWDGVRAEDVLGTRLRWPVRVESDSGLTALAEHRRGAGRRPGTVLVLACEHTGVGGALMGGGLARHVLEVGHLSIEQEGLLCPCGQRGCFEMYVDGRALLRETGTTTLSEAFEHYDVVAAAADRLGWALSSLVNVVVPARVVLAGVLGEIHRVAGDRVDAHVARSVVARTDHTEIVAGQVTDPVLVGAAELGFDPFLDDPADFPEVSP